MRKRGRLAHSIRSFADILSGISCWLVDLARRSPSKWQFHGVDVAKVQSPAKEYLPKNVSLKVLDVLGRIPDELVEKFDVVHTRAFATIVKNSDPMPLLKNLVRMLSRVSLLLFLSQRSIDNCL